MWSATLPFPSWRDSGVQRFLPAQATSTKAHFWWSAIFCHSQNFGGLFQLSSGLVRDDLRLRCGYCVQVAVVAATHLYSALPHILSTDRFSKIDTKSDRMVVGTCLITGGAGYIGSFTALALLEADYEVVIVDNCYNASPEAINRIELICGKRPAFYKADITDAAALEEVFKKHPALDSVIHFAALKAVGESGEIPLDYYRVNVQGTLTLITVAAQYGVTNIVYSSSATVYGDATRFPNMIPIPEECPLGPTNPYGNTKFASELMITDHIAAERAKATKAGKQQDARKWNAALLRYFNPCGSHPSGIMGEDPAGVPYNLLPLLAQVATGKRKELLVFGDDYNSHDGTAIRDYIHILDLAQGHLSALNYLRSNNPGVRAWNLGTGRGSTVFEIIAAFSKAVGRQLPYKVVERRAGDVLDLTSNPSRANKELDWKTKRTMEEACADLWRWTENNPDGYRQQPPKALLERLETMKQQENVAM